MARICQTRQTKLQAWHKIHNWELNNVCLNYFWLHQTSNVLGSNPGESSFEVWFFKKDQSFFFVTLIGKLADVTGPDFSVILCQLGLKNASHPNTKFLTCATEFKEEKEKEKGGKAWKKKWNWKKKEKWEQEGEQRAGNLTRLPYESKKACGIFSDHHWL